MFKFNFGSQDTNEKNATATQEQMQQAIEALNQLVEFHQMYQEYENNKNGGKKTIIELKHPWKTDTLFGSDKIGIGGRIVLKNLKTSVDHHPLYNSLQELRLRSQSFSVDQNEYSAHFFLVDPSSIECIPAKVKSIIEDYSELMERDNNNRPSIT